MFLGKKIERFRKELGLSQSALARKVGCEPPTINRIESGKIKQPSHDLIEKIAKALAIPLENLSSSLKKSVDPNEMSLMQDWLNDLTERVSHANEEGRDSIEGGLKSVWPTRYKEIMALVERRASKKDISRGDSRKESGSKKAAA